MVSSFVSYSAQGGFEDYPLSSPLGTQWVEANQLIQKQKWTEAVSLLKGLYSVNPKEIAILGALSLSLTRLGQRTEAVDFLHRFAADQTPIERERLAKRSRILSRTFVSNATFEKYQDGLNAFLAKKYRSAREKFERVLQDEPQNCEVLIRLGQCLVAEDEVEAAIQRLAQAKKVSPTDSEISFWLGKAYLARGNFREALRSFKLLDFEIRNAEMAVIALSEGQVLSGQVNLAFKTLEKDIDENPLHVESLWLFAKIKLQTAKGDLDSLWSARKDLQLALSRVDRYDSIDRADWELSAGVYRSSAELKLEIQKLLQVAQSRIDDAHHR